MTFTFLKYSKTFFIYIKFADLSFCIVVSCPFIKMLFEQAVLNCSGYDTKMLSYELIYMHVIPFLLNALWILLNTYCTRISIAIPHIVRLITELHNFMQLCMFQPYRTAGSFLFSMSSIKLITIYGARKTKFRYNITLTYLQLSTSLAHNSRYYIRNSGKHTFYFSNLIKCLSETHQPPLSNTIYISHISKILLKCWGCW